MFIKARAPPSCRKRVIKLGRVTNVSSQSTLMDRSGRGLIIDADSPSRTTLVAQFEHLGWEMRCCSAIADARNVADGYPADLVVTEMRWTASVESSVLTLIEELCRRAPAPTVVVVTDYPSIATAMSAARKGAAAYLNKPVNAAMILAAGLGESASDLEVRRPTRPMSLQRAEWEYLSWILRSCGFNRSKAARVLGIGRRTLQRKLEARPPAR